MTDQLSSIQGALNFMQEQIKAAGFDLAEAKIWFEGHQKIYANVTGRDQWQKDLEHYSRVMQLDWSEFYEPGTSIDLILAEMWTAIYAAKPLDERELGYTMKRLSGLAELDLSSEFGKMLAARCKAVYEEAKSLQLTFIPQPAPAQPESYSGSEEPF